MTRLDRRTLLLAATLVATQASMPEWLAHAFGLASKQDPDSLEVALGKLSTWRRGQLRDAAATARTLGRPLLVLLVPDGQPSHAVGQWYGAFFRHARTEALFDVSLCVVVCASADELKTELGTKDANVAPPKQGVAMLLIDLATDPKAAPTKVTRIEPELELVFPHAVRGPGKHVGPGRDPELDRAERTWRENGIACMAKSLHDGLQRHVVDRGQQAATVAATLREADQKQLQAWLREGTGIELAQMLHAAPLLQQRITELPVAQRAARQAELGIQLRSALVNQPVLGAAWGTPCPTCGLGHVPPLCELFLNFYTQPPEAK